MNYKTKAIVIKYMIQVSILLKKKLPAIWPGAYLKYQCFVYQNIV